MAKGASLTYNLMAAYDTQNTIHRYLCDTSESIASFNTMQSRSICVCNHHATASLMRACLILPFSIRSMPRSRVIDLVAFDNNIKQYKTISCADCLIQAQSAILTHATLYVHNILLSCNMYHPIHRLCS